MASDDDQHFGEQLPDPGGQTHGAKSLRREVALETDDVGGECDELRESLLDAVDAHIDDLAGMPFAFETAGHALQTERLDERDHLQADNSPDRGLQK